jgi:hypothetical protein
MFFQISIEDFSHTHFHNFYNSIFLMKGFPDGNLGTSSLLFYEKS